MAYLIRFKGLTEDEGQRWNKLIKNRPPQDEITKDLLVSSGKNPPRLYYGWPVKRAHVLDYARRHKLCPTISAKVNRDFKSPTELFDFANIPEEDLQNPQTMASLCEVAKQAVALHLNKTTGASLDVACPLSLEWDYILYLWTNEDIEEKFLHYCRYHYCSWFDKARDKADKAINEFVTDGSSEPSKLQWWWSVASANIKFNDE